MTILRTTTCHQYGHPEFQIAFDASLVPVEGDLHWFIDWLEQSVADGERFSPGQTCQIGWMVTEVRQGEGGTLSLWEPDMHSMPIVWVESLSNTLAHLRLQKYVVESVLLPDDVSFPSLLQSALICTRLRENNGLVMERMESKGRDSGWFCGCRGEDHDHNNVSELKCVSLYEAAVRYTPQIIPYLALPAGVLIGLNDSEPSIFLNGESLAFKPGSLLDVRHPKKK
jgi:hypothetical protein